VESANVCLSIFQNFICFHVLSDVKREGQRNQVANRKVNSKPLYMYQIDEVENITRKLYQSRLEVKNDNIIFKN